MDRLLQPPSSSIVTHFRSQSRASPFLTRVHRLDSSSFSFASSRRPESRRVSSISCLFRQNPSPDSSQVLNQTRNFLFPSPKSDDTKPNPGFIERIVRSFEQRKNEKRERVVKASRDITMYSRKVIFQVHRLSKDNKEEVLEKVGKDLEAVRDQHFSRLMRELQGSDFWTLIKIRTIVEADYEDAWWTGFVVKKIEDNKYLVLFDSLSDIIQFDTKHLRPHLQWGDEKMHSWWSFGSTQNSQLPSIYDGVVWCGCILYTPLEACTL